MSTKQQSAVKRHSGQPTTEYRASLLNEAGAILARVQAAVASLPADATAPHIEAIMRDIHSYKSLAAFAKQDAVARCVTEFEAYLGLIWQGRLPLNSQTVSLIERAVGTLALMHAAFASGQNLDCSALAEEMQAALAASAGTPNAPRVRQSASRAVLASARPTTAQIDVAQLAEMEALAATSYRLMQRLGDSSAFKRDERIDVMRMALENSLQHLEQLAHSARCCPLRELFAPAAALLVEMAPEYGRRLRVDLDVDPIDVEISLVQALRPIIMHVFRNAVAHGVEEVEARVAAGKPPEGVVSVSAKQQGDRLVIAIGDDGRGFDTEALRASAVALGAVSAERVTTLSDDEAISLARIPGMSTASRRTELSGTGMGLASVAEGVSALGGSMRIESERGRGAIVTLELPLPSAY